MRIEDARFLLSQEPDSCSDEPVHELKVSIVDAGGGPYIVLRTARWSINPDEIDQFAVELKAMLNFVERQEPATKEPS